MTALAKEIGDIPARFEEDNKAEVVTLTSKQLEQRYGAERGRPTWGFARGSVNYTTDYKYKVVECCCCAWLNAVDWLLTTETWIASDVPADELDRTKWHEQSHRGHARLRFRSGKWRDNAESWKKPFIVCNPGTIQASCDSAMAALDLIVTLAFSALVEDFQRMAARDAEFFHNNEEDLWQHYKTQTR